MPASKNGPPPPRADHLPLEPQVPCSVANDQAARGFEVRLRPEQEARAAKVYRSAIVITAHDHCFHAGDFRDMEAAGITVRTIKPTVDGVYFQGTSRYNLEEEVAGWFERGRAALQILDRRVAESRGKILVVRRVEDIERAKRERKLGVIYSFEGARPLAGKIENVQSFYEMGLRELQLYWAVPSPLKKADRTLSDFGFAVIREMNRLGMVIDASHMPDAAFRQVLETSSHPIVISHCAVAAVSGAKPGGTDQLSDDAIRQMAANGGAICLHFYEGYIRPRHGETATVVDLVDHMEHIRKLVGIETVALGVDYFPEKGWHWIEGAERMQGMPNVVREMVRRDFTDQEIRKVLGGNLMRVYRKVWKA